MTYNSKGLALCIFFAINLIRSMNRYDEALKCCDKAISLDKKCGEAYANKGFILISVKIFKLYQNRVVLRSLLNNMIQLQPTNLQQKNILFEHHLNQNKTFSILVKYYLLLFFPLQLHNNNKQQRTCFKINYYIIFRMFNLNRQEEAIKCYDQVMILDPKFVDAYNNKGLALYSTISILYLSNLNRFEEAIKCYDQAVKLDPKNGPAYSNKGMILHDLNRFDEAIKCYDQAIKADPKYADMYFNKGLSLKLNIYSMILTKLKRFPEALVCFDQAIDAEPFDLEFYEKKANCLLQNLQKSRLQ